MTAVDVQDHVIYMANVNEGYTRDGKEGEVVGPGREISRVSNPIVTSPAKRRSWRLRWPLCCNILVVVLVVAFLILHELNVLPHHKGGFYCGDPKISFTFEGDTVSIVALVVVCSIVPFFLIAFFELLRYRPEKYSMSNVRCSRALKNSYSWYGEYIVTFVFNLFLMEVVKGIIGEPRPHFLDTCKPDKAVNCTPGTYISSYTCTNTKYSKWFISDSIKSFPSGHTALGLYMGIFLFCYLQKRAYNIRPKLAVILLQTLLVSWGLVCSCTRIIDNRHHWWDVLAGGILAVVLSYYSVVVLCKNFTCSNPQLTRSVNTNGDAGRTVENHHNSVKSIINSSNIMSEDFDTGLRQIT